ncbi:MAG: hypothetical protein HZA52_07235 [Planctomycetes bacterium]|nr:hypothetical protein [Planctomycetota bacterium]
MPNPRLRPIRRTAALWLAVALFVAPTQAQLRPGNAARLAPGEPSDAYQAPQLVAFPALFFRSDDGTTFVAAEYAKHERKVRVRARYFVDGDRQRMVESTREWSTEFFPTWVATVGEHRLCVAGKRASGNTVIEFWTFALPALVNEPATGAAAEQRKITPGDRTAVRVVYDADVEGRRIVRTCAPLFGAKSERLLVVFGDSDELCSLDIDSGALELVATPRTEHATARRPLLPLLKDGRRTIVVSEHPRLGWCYWMLRHTDCVDDTPPDVPQIVLLLDRDKDGAIDELREIGTAEFDALGFGDARNFLQTWKY